MSVDDRFGAGGGGGRSIGLDGIEELKYSPGGGGIGCSNSACLVTAGWILCC